MHRQLHSRVLVSDLSVETLLHELLRRVKPALQDLLSDDSSSGRHLVLLTDVGGEILWRVGSREVLRCACRLKFFEGADWSELPRQP